MISYKDIKKFEAGFAIIFVVAVTMIFYTSCISAKSNAYKTLAAISTTVDISLKAYADARVEGKIDDITHEKVIKLKKQYEVAFTDAAILAQVDLTSSSPTNLTNIAIELITLINQSIKK